MVGKKAIISAQNEDNLIKLITCLACHQKISDEKEVQRVAFQFTKVNGLKGFSGSTGQAALLVSEIHAETPQSRTRKRGVGVLWRL